MEYQVKDDLALIQELLYISRAELAKATHISVPTLNRWASGSARPNRANLDALYSYAYRRNVELNRYKEQFLAEDTPPPIIPLYHGAKSALDGPIGCDRSRANNDLGHGFYCGETFSQTAMFVSGFPDSCVYALTFNPTGLRALRYGVELDWMLCVSLCRGKLGEYRDTSRARELLDRLEDADYVVAPIADNRMFQIIDEFADAEITDAQCVHALSATDLGMQYVMRTERAVDALTLKECCFLCGAERDDLRTLGTKRAETGRNKAKAARRQYRGQGVYVEELFDEGR